MQFVRDRDLYKVARITGPTHNLLAIRLSDGPCETEITALPVKEGNAVRLRGDEVAKQVRAGLAAINRELGREYFVSEVQFVPSDSPSSSVYELLVRALVERVHSGGAFVEVA